MTNVWTGWWVYLLVLEMQKIVPLKVRLRSQSKLNTQLKNLGAATSSRITSRMYPCTFKKWWDVVVKDNIASVSRKEATSAHNPKGRCWNECWSNRSAVMTVFRLAREITRAVAARLLLAMFDEWGNQINEFLRINQINQMFRGIKLKYRHT